MFPMHPVLVYMLAAQLSKATVINDTRYRIQFHTYSSCHGNKTLWRTISHHLFPVPTVDWFRRVAILQSYRATQKLALPVLQHDCAQHEVHWESERLTCNVIVDLSSLYHRGKCSASPPGRSTPREGVLGTHSETRCIPQPVWTCEKVKLSLRHRGSHIL
jgi:hypothetical protein